jgi:hypothetical protein
MTKTWREKYNTGKPSYTTVNKRAYADVKEGEGLLIPSPEEVDNYMKAIPKGETRSVLRMREDLAKKYKVDKTCPLVSGIMTRIVSEVAIEDMAKGKSATEVTPFWRVVVPGSPLAKKLSSGESLIVELRAQEGI